VGKIERSMAMSCSEKPAGARVAKVKPLCMPFGKMTGAAM
jgi:hypothetical protein